jgi:hypothetical protein
MLFLLHLIPISTSFGRYYYYDTSFTNEETEAEKDLVPSRVGIQILGGKFQSWCS